MTDDTGPPPDTEEQNQAKSSDRKEAMLKEFHADMRALRDTEFKVTTLFFQYCAFVVAGSLYASNAEINANSSIVILGIFFLLSIALWMEVYSRINHDNLNYRNLSDKVIDIYKHFNVYQDFAFKDGPEFGKGNGFQRTKFIVSLVATTTTFITFTCFCARVLR